VIIAAEERKHRIIGVLADKRYSPSLRWSHEEAFMHKLASVLIVIGAALADVIASQAHAQATRTWVSGVGDDANPCSRTAPCKTFAGAISKPPSAARSTASTPAVSAS
jgi:hypothetical protein